ncbi:MAG: hypothetical protein P4M15_10635 [Alphaproteobacteria bacterium]|nr:hypothetical protein [Alphaproteobacteria bacterium]
MNVPEIKSVRGEAVPAWIETLRAAGYVPYIATSESLLPTFNTAPFGQKAQGFLMENPDHGAFHEAYLLSNSLSFKSPDLKMPHWVLIDCALMQTAVVGFMKARADLPDSFLDHYRRDPSIDLDRLDYIPVSGQIASPTAGGKNLSGFSLFSLGSTLGAPKRLGLYTKALALEVYRAAGYEWLYGITQYDNPAIKIHGRFSPRMEIVQPIVSLHPKKDMTLIYRMAVDYDPMRIDEPLEAIEPSFWLQANDIAGKNRMQRGIADGKRYSIAPPFAVTRNGEIHLPIIEEKIK